MLKKDFETCSADPLYNVTLITVGIHITNLSYLKDKSFCFIKFLNGNIKKSNKILVELNTSTIILKINDQDLLNLIDLEVKQINKKKEKAKKRK